jgi:hypothetical protein
LWMEKVEETSSMKPPFGSETVIIDLQKVPLGSPS